MKLRGRQVMEPGPPMSAHSDRGIPIILRYNKSQTVSRSMSICSKTPFLSGACFAVIERSLPSRGLCTLAPCYRTRPGQEVPVERKSGGPGRRVSVSVDHVGRRLLYKQTQQLKAM